MITIKKPEEIERLRECGKRLARILGGLAGAVAPGVSTLELETLARKLMKEEGVLPAFLHLTPYGATRPYPASICVSINDAIVHGIPNENPKTIKDGDIVSIDTAVIYEDMYTDSALTVPAGAIDDEAKKLMDVTREALYEGIKVIRSGVRTGDIGAAIEKYVKPFGYGIVRELSGHGVGYELHEDPYVPNYGKKGTGEKLVSGMVIAIEPMLNEGTERIVLEDDGYTYRTYDKKRSAHFEHTIVVTDNGAEVLTLI
jgi:methionyl aminopeptidase